MRFGILFLTLVVILGCTKQEVRQTIPEDQQPAELLKYGQQFYQSGDYENAFRAYGIIYYNFPSSREYIDAAIGLSRCYGAMENYEKEFDILYTLLQGNLIPSKVPQIYNAIAEFYERSAGISQQLTGLGEEDYETAISYYNKAINYPNSEDKEAKSFAMYKIGFLYDQLGDTKNAIETYQKTINQFADTEWALRAEQGINDIRERMRLRAEYEQSGWMTPDTTAGDTLSSPEVMTSEPDSLLSPSSPTPEQTTPDTTSAPADTTQHP